MKASKIIAYRGFGNGQRIIVAGHVFRKHRVWELDPRHTNLHNIRQTLRRFRARPLGFAKLRIDIAGISRDVPADARGFFATAINGHQLAPGWYPYKVFSEAFGEIESEFFIPNAHTTGVISDIDDTLLVSHSTRIMRKMALLLFRNAYSRKPVAQVLKWYHMIRELNDGVVPEDFFYVSNSEWNLYDFLRDFFDINGLPKGIFMLRDLKKGLRDLIRTGKPDSGHKEDMIRFLLEFFPQKPFILAGDSGQKDIDIYTNICQAYPSRIKGVIIRQISYKRNDPRLEAFKSFAANFNIPFMRYH